MDSATKAAGEFTPVGGADKRKKQPQRLKNRRSKQNLAATLQGGGCSSLNSQQLSDNVSDVAFSSLPSLHIGETEPLGVAEGAYSRSCPLPGVSSSSEQLFSNGSNLLANPGKRKLFVPHLPVELVEDAIEKGHAFRATFRVNAHNRQEAYCSLDGVPVDVLINGADAQNRAIEGDVVAIRLDPVTYWSKLKGSPVPSKSAVTGACYSPPEVGGLSESCTNQEESDANCSLPVDRRYGVNDSACKAGHTPPENGSEIACHKSDERKCITPEILKASCFTNQDEASRALSRISTMINSCPSKRPTGRVLAILKKSPRRGAVIGFLAAQEDNRMQNNAFLKKDRQVLLDHIKLLPTDPKFPKMVVSFTSLPGYAREKLIKGDMSLERELIAAEIEEWSDESPLPNARVINILGRGEEIEPQVAAILFENAISNSEFSPESLDCIPDLPWKVPEKEFETRKDFRNICTVTVDPSSAIELDDALSVEVVSDEIFRIGVHISDVSYFVLPDTTLDTEAQARSTSVFILRHKLAMLPPRLSEGLCSLLPGVDRLAFSITWDINRSGKVVDRWIGRSIIQSCCKLSYELVLEIIDETFTPEQCKSSGSPVPKLHGCFGWKDVISCVRNLYEISALLRKNRFKGGALWLDSSKLAFSFDECGAPYNSFLHERKESCYLVEEFMLLANMSVAEVISRSFPDCALLRRHPEPNLRKLQEFETFWRKHGFELDTSSSGQLHLSLSKIREKLQDDPVLFDILVSYAARPMQTAAYFCTGELRGKENDWAHYALSVPFYTHFTSPIRRYPDIIVHRILSAALVAEQEYMRKTQLLPCTDKPVLSNGGMTSRCFTGLRFNKNAAESEEGREALMAAACKFKILGCKALSETVAYCNERKLASRRAEEAGEKLYLWTLLKKKEMLVSEARVLGLGPRFMSVYIHKFAMERRIYYDEFEGLAVEWLDATSTLVLDFLKTKRAPRRAINWRKLRPLEDAVLLTYPPAESDATKMKEPSPAMFPLVLKHLSTVPVALHSMGGDDGPLDIGARLYTCSYCR